MHHNTAPTVMSAVLHGDLITNPDRPLTSATYANKPCLHNTHPNQPHPTCQAPIQKIVSQNQPHHPPSGTYKHTTKPVRVHLWLLLVSSSLDLSAVGVGVWVGGVGNILW